MLRTNEKQRKDLNRGGGVQAVLLSLLFLLAATAAVAAPEVRVIDDFNAGLNPNWKVETFKGQTQYAIAELDDERVLSAYSEAAASGLVFEISYSLSDYPVLSWRWKVANILPRGDARTRAGDDYAARIYVVFPHWFFPKTRSINYIWANRLPMESRRPSSYTSNSVMVAVQSGSDKVGQWITERRNVREDYRVIFGTEPPAVGAIAIMTDADNTGGTARAWYDDLRIEKE